MLAVALGIMVVQIDGTVVSVANPAIATDLRASLSGIQWVTTGYLLVLAGLVIPSGTVADKIGYKRAFVVGISGFTLASLLCGLSRSIEFLVGARVLQAVFAALLVPSALAVIKSAFPAEKLAVAIGVLSSFTALALAGGPILGGLLVQVASWQWVFLINLPLGAVGAVLGGVVIGESAHEGSSQPLDVRGAVTLALAMVSIVWSITSVQRSAWTAPSVLGSMAAGIALFALFVALERRGEHPMVPLGLFASRPFALGSLIMLVTMFAFYAVLFYLTFYLQAVQGRDGTEAGVALLPLTAVFTVSSPVGGWITNWIGYRWTLVTGGVLVAASLALLQRLTVESSAWTLVPPLVLSGCGMGLMMVAATQAIIGNAPAEKAGVASGIQQSMTQLGGVLGTAVFGTILASLVDLRWPSAVAGVAGFSARLSPVLTSSAVRASVYLGFSPAARRQLAEQLMGIRVPSNQVGSVVDRVTAVAHEVFVDGLRSVFAVSAVVAVVAAVLALFVGKGTATSHEAAPEPVHTAE
jgi:EmrB/QacA subfamily drug resistance transporter